MKISLRGLFPEPFSYGFNFTGDYRTDAGGLAVTLDTANDNAVKLAGDGDYIIGRLELIEDRGNGVKTCTVTTKGGLGFRKAAATNIPNGSTIVGAGNGLVKAAATADLGTNYVVETETDELVVAVLR